jgi:hypothetical protein
MERKRSLALLLCFDVSDAISRVANSNSVGEEGKRPSQQRTKSSCAGYGEMLEKVEDYNYIMPP